MIASIITIGDELLIGQVVNTNATYIAEALNKISVTVKNILTVGDTQEDILQAFIKQFSENDIIISTGGLGPTHDDITKKTICKFFNTELVKNEDVKANVERILALRNMKWTSAADEQTYVPDGCKIIPNKHGTAPGMLFERDNKFFIALPGIPYEMKQMIDEFVLPLFSNFNNGRIILHRTLRTTGIAEAFLSELIGDIDELTKVASLAFLPSPTGVSLRISATSDSYKNVREAIAEVENKIRSKANDYIYGTDDETIEQVLGKLLSERNLTIAVAESCTGGLIANRITNVPGSSKYFERGIVTYSNRSKTDLLGVPENLIIKHGAVSEEVAKAMAAGIREISKTDIGISTTGIAGPTGATPDKPLGLVWIGYADLKNLITKKFLFGDDRVRVKIRSSQAAMELIRRIILKIQI
ncbi:MAG: competence/damage-inducible protein A [Bacteroidetes bacterium]|nr:competence/damage-inducible protein A [Bacteroidota bacterium]MBU1422122.1 competence/damage-inducible protein A [Bacteroidota bacterium]MBU2471325.1 competence/damage-inducible protein A [Bacteroidota bacterium]MBU2635594.1 competence/damage-inducible protein A [Bacteroidota bacterium]